MEENQKPQESLVKHALKWGGIVGAIAIFFTLVLYLIDYGMLVQLKFLFIFLLVYLAITCYAGIEYRKSIGGFMPFGKAWQHGYVILIFSGLISTIFMMIMYNVIDTELPQKLLDATMENTRTMMEGFGAPNIDEELAKAEERTRNQFTISGQLMGYGVILITSAVMALISGAIVKKNEPVEM